MMPAFGYVGWSGRGNLGDDAIYEAIRARLQPARVIGAPLYPQELARFLVSGERRELRRARPLLGGGTVLGRANWRMHLRTTLLLARVRPALMLGAGVEDPVFSGTHSFSSAGELGRWRHLLEEFDRVTVRGPRSKELLAQVGVDADVVGDPALLLEPELPTDPEERTLGVALGFGDDLWGHSQEAVVDAVSAAVRALAGSGWRIRFFVVNAEDREHAIKCARQAGLDPLRTAFLPAADPAEYLAQVARCTVMVGERLHAVVLAAGARVPAVMLEYQPKCGDFMESIERTAWSVRTDAVTGGGLLARIEALAEDRVIHAAQIEAAVGHLRGKLEAELLRIRAVSGLEPAADPTPSNAPRGAGAR
ncbi:MAG: polysaccharide pyruvyl transferase family protein [Acidimicrobiia bacterium]